MIIGIVLTVLVNHVVKASVTTPCHCEESTDWDSFSQTCESRCEEGWSGQSCERGRNIVLYSSAFQSSTYGDASLYSNGKSRYSADKAVDGDKSSKVTTDNCAMTHRSRNPWWYVVFNNSVEYSIESVTIQYFYQSGKRIPCNCLQGSKCLDNGYCPYGCAVNWTGPACRIGPLPRKIAYQSSADKLNEKYLSARGAIDDQLGVSGERADLSQCSVTLRSERDHWWLVVLDYQKLYVVQSVTIYNQFEPSNRYLLRNFSIVYSTSTSARIIEWTTKETCVYFRGENRDYIRHFTCTHKAIARSVGIEFAPRPIDAHNVLALCEVYVYGYEYIDCPPDYTGPGCVLHNCNSDLCRSNGGWCDVGGACLFSTCQDKSFTPPHCWMRDYGSNQLVNFDILADDAGTRPPDPQTWRTCQSVAKTDSLTSTFTCNNITGQRLAIYMKGEYERMLTLCEVTVSGFPSGDFKSKCQRPSSISASDCHCAGSEHCTFDNDFKCPGSCQSGWMGDDCRSRYLATYTSETLQINTLCDENLAQQQLCLKGPEKALDNDVTTCTSTSATDFPWWLVQLGDNDTFGIEQVQIIMDNIKHNNRQSLRLLLLTSNSSGGVPNLATWKKMSYDVQNLATDGMWLNPILIARQLAIFVNSRKAFLSICEVFVRGYNLKAEVDLSRSAALVMRRSTDSTVNVALNLSKRLWYSDPTALSLAWKVGDGPTQKVPIDYEGPRWYTFNLQLPDSMSNLIVFWWETQYCAKNDKTSCRVGTTSIAMATQPDDY